METEKKAEQKTSICVYLNPSNTISEKTLPLLSEKYKYKIKLNIHEQTNFVDLIKNKISKKIKAKGININKAEIMLKYQGINIDDIKNLKEFKKKIMGGKPLENILFFYYYKK